MGALSVRPFQADLSVSVAGTSAYFNAPLTYTVTVTNNGTSSATGVVLTDTLAAGLTFGSATPSQGSYNSSTGVWNIGTVLASASPTPVW